MAYFFHMYSPFFFFFFYFLAPQHVGFSQTMDQTHVLCIVGRFLSIGPPGKSYKMYTF